MNYQDSPNEYDQPEPMSIKQVFELGYIIGIQSAVEIVKNGGDIDELATGINEYAKIHEQQFGSSELLTFTPLIIEEHIKELLRKAREDD